MQNLPPTNLLKSFVSKEIFNLWILISAFKIKLSQIQKLFSLWMSGIIEKEALFLYATTVCALQRWVPKYCSFLFCCCWFLKPKAARSCDVFPLLSAHSDSYFSSQQYWCLRLCPWFSVPATDSIPEQDCSPEVCAGGKAGWNWVHGMQKVH